MALYSLVHERNMPQMPGDSTPKPTRDGMTGRSARRRVSALEFKRLLAGLGRPVGPRLARLTNPARRQLFTSPARRD